MHAENLSPRIPPLEPPYTAEIAATLEKWMPPEANRELLKLFRTLYQNPQLSDRMFSLGAGILGRRSSIDPYEREIVIDRVCARCDCEYEWGVHVVFYGQRVGLPENKLQATRTAPASDPVWSEREQILVQLVDELHETSTVSDELWTKLAAGWSASQLIELLVMVGWYHLISFVANATRVEREPWAAHFPDVSA